MDAIEAFISERGVTKCPPAYLLPVKGATEVFCHLGGAEKAMTLSQRVQRHLYQLAGGWQGIDAICAALGETDKRKVRKTLENMRAAGKATSRMQGKRLVWMQFKRGHK